MFASCLFITSVLTAAANSMDTFISCVGSEISQHLVLPGVGNYSFISTGDRNRVDRTPLGVLLVQKQNEIPKIVQCAFQTDMRIVPRGGGHSYESLSSQDGSITVDLAAVNQVSIVSREADGKAAIARVQAGARLGHVYNQLWKQGGYTFNGGTCPSVGISGHISGGGYGMLARVFGLAADQTVGFKIVLFNGTEIEVSADTHPDLFWAQRSGGSGSFGVVTEWLIKVYNVGPVVMFNLVFEKGKRFDLIKTWMNYFPTADARLTTQLNINKEDALLHGQFTGPRNDLDRILQESGVYNFGGIIHQQLEVCNALGAKAFTAGAGKCDENWQYLVPEIYNRNKDSGKFKSEYSSDGLSDDGIRAVVDGISAAPNWGWLQFEALGGYFANVSNDALPYNHRDCLFSMQYATSLSKGESFDSPGNRWISGFEASLKPYVNGQHYQNYPDLELGADFGTAYFGETNFARLRQIKAKYDPQNHFRNEQSIPLP
jgi:FAD/FMN-containing dehydrogenase